jgi:hypothetical protein
MNIYPYKLLQSDDEYLYIFFVKKGLKYTVKFKPSFWLYSSDAYEISIENDLLLQRSDGFDSMINATIIAILYNFLEITPNCSISYICDSSGSVNRSTARAKLFKRWFLQNNNGDYIHLQGSFKNSKIEHQYYTGILFSIYKSDIADLKETFQLLNEELNK